MPIVQTTLDGPAEIKDKPRSVVIKFLNTYRPEQILEKGEGFIKMLFAEHLIQRYGASQELVKYIVMSRILRDLQDEVASRKSDIL